MTDTFRAGKRVLSVTVALATLAWAIGAATLVAPFSAKAVTLASGSLIKGSLAAVYYYGSNGKRYVFPNEKTYKSWYSDYSTVQKISDADLATLMIGGNVTYKPGSFLLKIVSDNKVYAVSKGGVLRPIDSEQVAKDLYGAAWSTMVHDVSDAFFTNYTVGSAITAASQYDKAGELAMATSINADKGLTGSVVSSEFMASLNSGTPAAASVPKGATGVNFVKFDVKNGGSAALTVDQLIVHRKGPGAPGDFSNVYLYEGDTRLTTGRSVNSSTNEVTFSSLNLAMASGQTRTLWVAADMSTSAGAGNVSAFEVTKVLAGSVSASGVPVVGNDMTMTSASVGSVTITKSGSIVNPKVGQMQVQIGEFQLSAGSSEDLEVRRLTLFQAGSLSRSNLTNMKLKQAGVELASVAAVDSKDHIVFALSNPMVLEKGGTKTFQVFGDISGSARAADSVKISTEDSADVFALGRTYGYGATVTRTGYDGDSCTSSAGDCSYSAVEGGQITITFNGPAAKDVASNGKDVELYNFNMASQANVEVRNLRVKFTSVGGDDDADRGDLVDDTGDAAKDADDVANFTDIKVIDTTTGQIVAGPTDLTGGATYNDITQSLVFNNTFNLNAGQTRVFKVTADVANNTNADFAGDQVRVDLEAFQSSDIRNLDNSTYVATTDIVPNATITGNADTVRAPTLTVMAASTPVAQTYVQGAQGVEIAGFNFKAGDAQDLKITTLTLTGYVDATTDEFTQGQNIDGGETKNVTDILLTAKLWNGSTQVGDTKSPTASSAESTGGLLQFTNLNLVVAKGQTVTLKLTGNLASSISNLDDLLRFNVVAAADVTVQDPDGNAVTAQDADGGAFTSVPSAIITTTGNGTITYVRAASDAESEDGLVVAGNSNVVLAKYRFTAAKEDLKLSKIRMAVAAASTSGVTSMSLYDGSTLIAGPVAVNSAGQADFSGMAFNIAKDTSKTITVKGALNTLSAGAVSGSDLTVNICNGLDTGTDFAACGTEASNGTFEVRGNSAGSSTLITTGDTNDIAGYEKRLRKTKPTLTAVALPTGTLGNGNQVISKFTVTADSAEQVSIKHVGLSASINGTLTLVDPAAVTTVGIREVGGSIIPSTNAQAGTCNASGVCTLSVEFTSEQSVAAGTSKTYEAVFNFTGVDTAGESVSTSLLGDSAQVTGEIEGAAPATAVDDLDGTDPGTAAYNFIWSDNSAVPHNDVNGATADGADAAASDDWTNGRFVKTLPSDVQTMTR